MLHSSRIWPENSLAQNVARKKNTHSGCDQKTFTQPGCDLKKICTLSPEFKYGGIKVTLTQDVTRKKAASTPLPPPTHTHTHTGRTGHQNTFTYSYNLNLWMSALSFLLLKTITGFIYLICYTLRLLLLKGERGCRQPYFTYYVSCYIFNSTGRGKGVATDT